MPAAEDVDLTAAGGLRVHKPTCQSAQLLTTALTLSPLSELRGVRQVSEDNPELLILLPFDSSGLLT